MCVSGLTVTPTKTEGLWLGRCKFCTDKPLGIKWPKVLKILGVYVGYEPIMLQQKNFTEKLIKIRKILNLWKRRDLTIYGKILVIKSFALSQLLYVLKILPLPNDTLREVNEIIYTFLWNGPKHKVKQHVIIQDLLNGGARMIDIKEIDKSIKIGLVKRLLTNKQITWRHNMKTILGLNDFFEK